jgi:hypothetical protein
MPSLRLPSDQDLLSEFLPLFYLMTCIMDPLSISMAVITSLQVACSILSCCYSIRTEMKNAPWTLIRIIEETRDLRNLIETIEVILNKTEPRNSFDQSKLESSQTLSTSIKPLIQNCLTELQALESRIHPDRVAALLDSKRKALLQTILWRLKGDEGKQSIANLQRCREALSLALHSHNS